VEEEDVQTAAVAVAVCCFVGKKGVEDDVH
jgi:hypothetical protein